MRLSTLRRPGLASEAEVLDRVNRVLGPVEILDDASVRPQVCRILKSRPALANRVSSSGIPQPRTTSESVMLSPCIPRRWGLTLLA